MCGAFRVGMVSRVSARAASPCCPHHHQASRCRPHSRCPLPHSHPHNLAHSPTPMSALALPHPPAASCLAPHHSLLRAQ
ncbi:Med15 [Phodopus roborovskii]|uniref:Med15 protein n=1 Tax=Phodopus roborovskii TaxID=109678 RepID=A0AAU9ZHP1_PHORO|nr:Med15 [Phodopus roborovskii]